MKYKILSFLLVFLMLGCRNYDDIELSPEMKIFTEMIQGSYKEVTLAVEKYAANDDIRINEITMYDLDDPKVTEKNNDCYTIEFVTGRSVRVYEICWKNKKIIKINSYGIK